MKVVYIAGPFRGPTPWAVEQNIRRAEELAAEVWRCGAACICPHANSRFFTGVAPDEIFLEGDLEILRRCDAILMTPDWERSKGACAERQEAINSNLAIFHDLNDLKYWLETNS